MQWQVSLQETKEENIQKRGQQKPEAETESRGHQPRKTRIAHSHWRQEEARKASS